MLVWSIGLSLTHGKKGVAKKKKKKEQKSESKKSGISLIKNTRIGNRSMVSSLAARE